MSKLEDLIPNFEAVSPQDEVADPGSADEMYRTAAAFMREHTRNAEEYPLVSRRTSLMDSAGTQERSNGSEP